MRRYRAWIYLLSLFLTLGIAKSAGAAVVLGISDSYENGLGQWDLDSGCTWDTTHAHSGTHSMKCVNLDTGTTKNLSGNPLYKSQRAYRSFWAWIPINWDLGSDTHGHWSRNFGAGRNTQLDCLIWGPPGYTQHLTCEEFTIPKEWVSDDVTFENNSWNHFEYYFDAGTPNTANGFLQVWVNGTKVMDFTNQVMRATSGDWLTEIQMPSNLGLGAGTAVWIDDFEMWTDCPTTTVFSGAPSCSASALDTTAPLLAPTNLSLH